jgi:hypothetical protein
MCGNSSVIDLSTHRQPFTPLGAPPLKHETTALGRHALSEPMRLLFLAVVRLKRPFHVAEFSKLLH